MRKDGLLEYASVRCLMGVTAGETKREFTGNPTEERNMYQKPPHICSTETIWNTDTNFTLSTKETFGIFISQMQ